MFKRVISAQTMILPYLTMAQALTRPLTQGAMAQRPVAQRVALGGLIGAGMALAAIVIGKRLKGGALDVPPYS